MPLRSPERLLAAVIARMAGRTVTEPAMKAASALHLLALGACFVVQSGGLALSELPGVRRALQTMETRTEPSLSQPMELQSPDGTAARDLYGGMTRYHP